MNIPKDPPKISPWFISLYMQMKDDFKVDRNYQREEAWETSDKKWLIDTILRGMPIPLIFIHKKDGISWIVDGQQRLLTIRGFSQDDFSLDEEISGDIIKANNGKKIFSELNEEYKKRFLMYPLPMVDLENYKDGEIRSIYRRLQRGKPLTPAEILNASSGEIVLTMRKLATHGFFHNVVAIRPKRYKFYHLSAILLYLEHEGIKDISPPQIYDFFEKHPSIDVNSKEYRNVTKVLNYLEKAFKVKTPELKRPAWIFTIYLVTSHLLDNFVMNNQEEKYRKFICDFYESVENSATSGDTKLITFNIMVSKGTTTENYIKTRYQLMTERFLKEVNPQMLDENRLFSDDQKRQIFRRDNESCTACGKKLQWGDSKTQYHHKDYWIHGGETEIDKGQLVCMDCHLRKIHGIDKRSL